MGSRWRKAKSALGLNLCLYFPRTEDDDPSSPSIDNRFSKAVSISSTSSDPQLLTTNPGNSSVGNRLPKSGSRSSKKICSICLGTLRSGNGVAIFTAECSHTFHFHCIASNVKHGNQVCPVCRATWKEIPLQASSMDLVHGKARIRPIDWFPQEGNWRNMLRRIRPRADLTHQTTSLLHVSEPGTFDDDEPLDCNPVSSIKPSCSPEVDASHPRRAELKTYPEFSALSRSSSHENFTVLVHVKAPVAITRNYSHTGSSNPPGRAPVDLVTVLDVSGSMAGTKLALVKRAMGFVIQNLGPSDRLSIIAFSSTARRLFPLCRMSDMGRQQALQAVNSLVSSGGTNIAEGLKKGAKVMEDRKEKNPISSIMLLSDGQDTYTFTTTRASNPSINYQSLLPDSLAGSAGEQIPVHAFGFGIDHDAASMHSISELSGGTFSFIEAEGVIQDAFAQCIGGLLSVVIQDLHVSIECGSPSVKIGAIKAGSYRSCISSDGCWGTIEVGNLYAEEERGFLLYLHIPTGEEGSSSPLIKVSCVYRDPLSKERVDAGMQEVRIERKEGVGEITPSIEVDTQKNRLQAAKTMAEARALAERGDLTGSVDLIENCRKALARSVSAQAGNNMCVALDVELKEMQERMTSQRVYEASGRAYVLSGLSSHSWQRATARGDSTDSTSLLHAYQTPSMIDMLTRSHTTSLGAPSSHPSVRPSSSKKHSRPR